MTTDTPLDVTTLDTSNDGNQDRQVKTTETPADFSLKELFLSAPVDDTKGARVKKDGTTMAVDDDPEKPVTLSEWASTIVTDVEIPRDDMDKIIKGVEDEDLGPLIESISTTAKAAAATAIAGVMEAMPTLFEAFKAELMTELGEVKSEDSVWERFKSYAKMTDDSAREVLSGPLKNGLAKGMAEATLFNKLLPMVDLLVDKPKKEEESSSGGKFDYTELL